MNDDRGMLRSISWRDLCPWFLLARVFRVSIGIDALVLATLGVLFVPMGWWTSSRVFLAPSDRDSKVTIVGLSANQLASCPSQWSASESVRPDLPGLTGSVMPSKDILASTFLSATLPVAALFNPELSLGQFAFLLAGNLWTLAVWSICGGAIVRLAVVQLGCSERIGLKQSFGYSVRRFPSYVGGPLGLLLVVGLAALVPAFAGLLLRIDVFAPLAGLAWPIAMVCALVMGYCLLSLLFGWPLMWGTMGAENSDFFDSISRSFSYTFQRPLHYLFYASVAGLLGSLGWIVVYWFTELTLALAWWGASWGMGHERYAFIKGPTPGFDATQATAALNSGLGLIHLVESFVRSVAVGFTFSYLWCASAAIYLLLRRDVDQREFDDIYLEGEDHDFQLPSLPIDVAGVPGAPEPAPPVSGGSQPPALPGEGGGSVAPQPE